MTDTHAQRVQAYLDARAELTERGANLGDQIAEAKNGGQPWARLTVTDVQTIIDELDAAQSSSDREAGEAHALRNENSQLKAAKDSTPEFPTVTLCGSMRFYPRMLEVAAKLTAAGQIVLMPHDASLTGIENKTAIEHGAMLDSMHRAKIRMSRSVYVVNGGGYIGESTRGEIAYATEIGIPIQYDEEA